MPTRTLSNDATASDRSDVPSAARSPVWGYLAAILVFVVVAFALHHLAGEITYDDVRSALAEIGAGPLALSIAATVSSYFALTLYDVSALAYAGERRRYRDVAVVAFCAYAVGNTAGFGPLSGGAIRYRFYSRLGLDPQSIAKVIGFVTVAFGAGLAIVSLLAAVLATPRLAPALGLSEGALRFGSLAILACALVVLAILTRRGALRFGHRSIPMPSPGLAAGQLLVTAADIAFSSAALYVLLPETGLGFPAFVGLYAVAVGIGVLSHVPAGLGVFEAVIVAGLSGLVPTPTILSALLVYRVVYHVLPLVLAALLATTLEARQAWGTDNAVLRAASARIAPLVVSTLAIVAGLALVLASMTPTPPDQLDLLGSLLPLPAIEIAHFVSGILGLCLVVVGRGLGQRLDGAWWATMIVAGLSLLLCFAKAIALYEAMLLALLLVVLFASRHLFVRPASLFRQALTGPWLLAVAIVVVSAASLLLFAYQDVDYGNDLWLQFELSSDAPRSLRAFVGIAVLSCAVALWSLVRAAPGRLVGPTAAELDRAVAIVDRQDVADANLVRCADKSLLFSEKGDAFLMYGRFGRSWIALFEPFGADAQRADLVWTFIEMARAGGGRAAFYQVSPDLLSACADAGLIAIKLGETAIVDLATFDLKGTARSGLRQTYNKGNREGLSFELVPIEGVGAILSALRVISDAWLVTRKAREKRFSVGAFTDAYMLSQPVGILRHEGRIVAFANLLLTGTKAEASIDLMRHDPSAPRASMEYLFIRLMLHLKEDGYRGFNLGMAPMSGLSRRAVAPMWQQLGRVLFEHGGRFYNFKGLRSFKAKFDPDWQPRYLAVQGGLNPAIALADASAMIAGGLKGVVAR